MNELVLYRFEPIFKMWGRESFPDVYLERAVFRTKDLTDDEFKEFCHLLIEHCERAPSLVKIVTFASYVRARRKKENNILEINGPECTECNDLGVMKVEGRIGDLLMRCENDKCLPSYYWKLPRLNRLHREDFKVSKCPVDWFKPRAGESRQDKVEEWKTKVKISEVVFKDKGFEIDQRGKQDASIS